MEHLEKIFKKTGWISILESVIFAILGVILIWKPNETVRVIAYILGAIFIIIGIGKIINYFMSKGKYDFYNYDLIYGVIAAVVGIVAIAYSSTIGSVFRIIIGIWILYTSLIRLNLSAKLRAMDVSAWAYSLIIAIIMFIGGLYIILNSGAIITTIGIMMVIYSIMDIIEDVIFMKNVKEIF